MFAESGVSASIAKDNDGEDIVVIDTDQGLFVGVDESEYRKIAKDYLNKHFKNTVLPLSNYGLVSVNKTGIGKYTYSGKKIENSANNAKMKAATELDNLLRTAEYIKSTGDRKNHNFAADGFDYYKTRFIVDGRVFEGIIDIGVSEKGAAFYGMTNIENVTSRYYGKYSNLLLGYKSVTQSDISDSRIPQDKTTVKNNISEKSKNDTGKAQKSLSYGTEAPTTDSLSNFAFSAPIRSDIKPKTDTPIKDIGPVRKDIAPVRKDIGPVREDTTPANDTPTTNSVQGTKQKISEEIKAIEAEISNNEKFHEEVINNYDEQISKLREELSAVKDKRTKKAKDILNKISSIEALKATIDSDYEKRINSLKMRAGKMKSPGYVRAIQKRVKMQENKIF